MEILKIKCERCGKEITSLYQKQLEQNYKVHLLSCEGKAKSEDTDDGNN